MTERSSNTSLSGLYVFRKIRAFRQTWQEAGPRATLIYAADQLLRHLRVGRAHCYLFVCQPVTTTMDRRFLARNLTCRILQDHDFDLLPDQQSALEYRISQNAIAVGAFVDDSPVATLWYTLGAYVEDEVRAMYTPLPAGQAAWDFGVEVAPQFRVGRTFFTLWAAAMDTMSARGCKFSFSRINAVNTASVQAHKRLGAMTIGHANFVIIGNLQIAYSSHTPRIHLSLSSDNRPCYCLVAGPCA